MEKDRCNTFGVNTLQRVLPRVRSLTLPTLGFDLQRRWRRENKTGTGPDGDETCPVSFTRLVPTLASSPMWPTLQASEPVSKTIKDCGRQQKFLTLPSVMSGSVFTPTALHTNAQVDRLRSTLDHDVRNWDLLQRSYITLRTIRIRESVLTKGCTISLRGGKRAM